MTTTTTTSCPDLEQLAAFADRRLSGAARDAVVEHLADCEGCYEVYAETLRIQEDLSPRADAPVVVHPRSFRPVRWALPAAALAAAAALAVVVVPRWLGTGTPVLRVGDVAAVVADSSLGDLGGWSEHGWPRKRGLGPVLGATETDSAKRAFRLGVHAVDLKAALQIEDRDTAERQTQQIETLLNQDDFLRFFSPQYRELRDRILDGADQQQLLATESRLEELLTEGGDPLFAFYHSFGKWTETARLAALTGHGEYFTGREVRRGLGKLREAELAEGVYAKLDEVEDLVETGPTEAALEELSLALEEVISGEGVR